MKSLARAGSSASCETHAQKSASELKAALLLDVSAFCASQFADGATLIVVSVAGRSWREPRRCEARSRCPPRNGITLSERFGMWQFDVPLKGIEVVNDVTFDKPMHASGDKMLAGRRL